jgi:hypothetical protein
MAADKDDTAQQVEGGEAGISLDYLNAKEGFDAWRNLGLQMAGAATAAFAQGLNAVAQMQQANAAAHAARVMATADHARGLAQVEVRGAQNGESGDHRVFANGATTDHQVDGQSVRVNGYEATAVYTSGVGPVQTASAGEAADNISDEDEN